jgi:predicted Zn-dependent protease with MMP-like domain
MSPNWEHLTAIAQEEVEGILVQLPPHLREKARALPVTFEPVPNEAWVEDGIDIDSLGLFVGPAFADEEMTTSPVPPQIIFFLENLWDLVDEDEPIYRVELRRTYLHELGHYLGLDEDDLDLRGLQ